MRYLNIPRQHMYVEAIYIYIYKYNYIDGYMMKLDRRQCNQYSGVYIEVYSGR